MAYLSTADLKTYLGFAITADDTLLTSLIASAVAIIEAVTGTTFEASADTAKLFSWGVDHKFQTLFLDDWLAAAPTTVTNGDGVVVAGTDYILLEPRRAPYYAIKLKQNANVVWTFGDSPESAISVLGRWGWSTTPPADIVQATRRLGAYLYRQKDAQTFDQTSFTELGIIKVKAELPKDVMEILERYKPLADY